MLLALLFGCWCPVLAEGKLSPVSRSFSAELWAAIGMSTRISIGCRAALALAARRACPAAHARCGHGFARSLFTFPDRVCAVVPSLRAHHMSIIGARRLYCTGWLRAVPLDLAIVLRVRLGSARSGHVLAGSRSGG